MTTMEQIRQQFPHPQSATDAQGGPESYCIGGAVYRSAYPGPPWPPAFPTEILVVTALCTLNRGLSLSMAWAAACDITRKNDREDFAGAWESVHRALTA